jgi:hypothetical protein
MTTPETIDRDRRLHEMADEGCSLPELAAAFMIDESAVAAILSAPPAAHCPTGFTVAPEMARGRLCFAVIDPEGFPVGIPAANRIDAVLRAQRLKAYREGRA